MNILLIYWHRIYENDVIIDYYYIETFDNVVPIPTVLSA